MLDKIVYFECPSGLSVKFIVISWRSLEARIFKVAMWRCKAMLLKVRDQKLVRAMTVPAASKVDATAVAVAPMKTNIS